MTNRMTPKTPKKKNFRTWLLGALAVIGAFFAGLFAVRHREDDTADPHFGEAPSDYLNHVSGFAEPRCTVDIPNLTEAQAQALEACYPQAVRLNTKEAPA